MSGNITSETTQKRFKTIPKRSKRSRNDSKTIPNLPKRPQTYSKTTPTVFKNYPKTIPKRFKAIPKRSKTIPKRSQNNAISTKRPQKYSKTTPTVFKNYSKTIPKRFQKLFQEALWRTTHTAPTPVTPERSMSGNITSSLQRLLLRAMRARMLFSLPTSLLLFCTTLMQDETFPEGGSCGIFHFFNWYSSL